MLMGQSDGVPSARDLDGSTYPQEVLKELKDLTTPKNCLEIWIFGIFLAPLSQNSGSESGRDSLNRSLSWEQDNPVIHLKEKKLVI